MSPVSLQPWLPENTESSGAKDSPEKILDAARQFESLLLEQILRTMRQSGQSGWMGSDDKASESLMDFAEQEFAKVMSAGGGFGLARTIADGLSRASVRSGR